MEKRASQHRRLQEEQEPGQTQLSIEKESQHIQASILETSRQTELPLLSQMLYEWNATATPYPRESSLAELFEQQVLLRPEAIALVFEEQHLTYAELNRHANLLAHRLRTMGVGPETIVGLCLERCIVMIAGLLAILKAGGAYLPL